MEFIIKVTVHTSRDPDCNPYSLTEYKNCRIEQPTPKAIRAFVLTVRQHFLDSYPGRQGKPQSDSLLPTDVEVFDNHGNYRVAVAA